MSTNKLTLTNLIKDKIHTIRGTQIIIDSDLAKLYHVPVKALNQAVKRNRNRFPIDFMFQLTIIEKNELVTKCDRLNILKHSSSMPRAFTEQGIASISGILKSKQAIEINIQIMRAFVSMRRFILQNGELFTRLDTIERKQLQFEITAEKNFKQLFNSIENKNITPNKKIFYDGQIFDAHTFVSNIIKSATKSVVLIDNYIDESILILFSKRKKCVTAIIHTKKITEKNKLDVKKFNEQYEPITIKEFKQSHDRFLIIDKKEIYHFGASLKDLGKKWFAFSKFEKGAIEMLKKLN